MSQRRSTTEILISGGCDGFPRRAIADTVERVMTGERSSGTVSITFLGPTRMRELNARALGHDYVTDVITFALPQPGAGIVGDLYICRFEAARAARLHGCSLREEVLRLVIHGVLHTLGYDHPENESRMVSEMWLQQERYLAEASC